MSDVGQHDDDAHLVPLLLQPDFQPPQMFFTPQNLCLGLGELFRPLALSTPGGRVGMLAPETQDARVGRSGPPDVGSGLGSSGDVRLGRSRLGSLDQSTDEDLSVLFHLREFFLEHVDVFELFTEMLQRADVFVPLGFRGVTVDAIVIFPIVLVHGAFKGGMLYGPTDGVGDARRRRDVGQKGRRRRVRVGQEGEKGGGELFLRRTVEVGRDVVVKNNRQYPCHRGTSRMLELRFR